MSEDNSSSPEEYNYLEKREDNSEDENRSEEPSRQKYFSQQFPQTFEGTLQKYQNLIMGLQKILLWKRPAILAGIIVAIDAIILLSYYYEVGVCAFAVLCVLIAYISVYFYFRFNNLLQTEVFDDKPEDEGSLDDLYTFEELCDIIIKWKSILQTVINFFLGRNFGEGYIRVLLTIGLWLLLAVIMIFVGNVWVLLLVIDAMFLLPGLVGTKANKIMEEKLHTE